MNRSAPEYRVGIGASSILMIFIVLSLTTLGVLSFASARADLVLTQRRTAQMQAYYGADARAQALLARIDEALLAADADPELRGEQVRALAQLDSAIVVNARGTAVSFVLPVSETQSLEVKLALHDAGAPTRYSIDRYQLIYTGEWEADDTIVLMTDIMDLP